MCAAHIARRVHDHELPLQGRRHDGPAWKIRHRVRHRAAEVVRAFIASLQVKPLNPVCETARQHHRTIAVDGQPPNIGHEPILPDDFRVEPVGTSRD